MEDVKDGSGWVRSLFVVRRAEDSCLRGTCDFELNTDERRKGKLVARGRRGTMMFMSWIDLVQPAQSLIKDSDHPNEARGPGPVHMIVLERTHSDFTSRGKRAYYPCQQRHCSTDDPDPLNVSGAVGCVKTWLPISSQHHIRVIR